MNVTSESVLDYKIKRYTNPKNKDYLEAVNIYLTYTAPALRTNTNQIAYWLEKLKESPQRGFYVLGYYLNDKVIGYCQFMHLKKQKIIVIDYMAIEKQYRKLSVFYQFVDLVQEYIEKNRLEYNYLVAEVGFLSDGKEPCSESKALIRLLRASGLGELLSEYYQPQLEKENHESFMKARLLLYSPEGICEIKKDTYLHIVNAIYFVHYLEWYIPFQEEEERGIYKKHLEKLYKKIDSSAHSKIKVTTTNSDALVQKKILSTEVLTGLGFWEVFFSFFLLVLTFLIILTITKVTFLELLLVFSMALFCVFAIMTLFDNKAQKALNNISDLIKTFFGKIK